MIYAGEILTVDTMNNISTFLNAKKYFCMNCRHELHQFRIYRVEQGMWSKDYFVHKPKRKKHKYEKIEGGIEVESRDLEEAFPQKCLIEGCQCERPELLP